MLSAHHTGLGWNPFKAVAHAVAHPVDFVKHDVAHAVAHPVDFLKKNVPGAEHFLAHPPIWLQVLQPELSPAVQRFAANVVIPGKGAQLVDAARKVVDAAGQGNFDAKTILAQIPNVIGAMSGGGDTTSAVAQDLINKTLSPAAKNFAAGAIVGKSGNQLVNTAQTLLTQAGAGHPGAAALVNEMPAVIGAMSQGIGVNPVGMASGGFGDAASRGRHPGLIWLGVGGLLTSAALLIGMGFARSPKTSRSRF